MQGFGAGFPRNPVVFTNQLAKAGTAPSITYTGVAATKAIGNKTSNTTMSSPVMMRLEIGATTTATGLSGTITFVSHIVCGEDRAYLPCTATQNVGELRRTYDFTAVRY
jgi:hypothetical protein